MSQNNDNEITFTEKLAILIVKKFFRVPNDNTRYLLEVLVERKIDEILEKDNIVDNESFILELHNNLLKNSLRKDLILFLDEIKNNITTLKN